MKNPDFKLKLLVLLLIFCAGAAGSLIAYNLYFTRPRNVVFITIDTLRADHLGCYGYPRKTSPAIDAFAAKSIVFRKCISQATSTLPSHASIFTSLYPPAHGVLHNLTGLSASVPSLVKVFRENGYLTGAIVSNVVLESRFGLNQGFQTYDETLDVTELNRRNFPERRADSATDAAIEWLRKHEDDEPFFLWTHYNDPHGAYYPPPQYRELFVEDQWYSEAESLPIAGENFVSRTIPAYQALFGITTSAYYVAQYDAEIRFTDDQIRRLLQFLEDAGLMSETIVVITADHGESFTERDLCFTHSFRTYDEQAIIPLIMFFPKMETPKQVDEQVRAIDIMPTLLDELDIENPYVVHGSSLMDVVSGNDSSPRTAVVSSDYGMDVFDSVMGTQKSLRTPRWKLTRNSRDKGLELYDLKMDPQETTNLAGQSPEVAAELNKLFDEWEKTVVKSAVFTPVLSPEKIEQLKSLGYMTK